MDAEDARGFGPIAGNPHQGTADQQFLKARDSGRQVFIRPDADLFRTQSRLVDEAEVCVIDLPPV